MSVEFVTLPDPAAVGEAAADRIVAACAEAIRDRGVCRLVLSGGGTPMAIYPLLAAPPRIEAVDWSRVEFFFGDERTVPPDHPDSNFGAAWSALLSQLPGVRATSLHRMAGESDDLDAAAHAYQAEIRRSFGLEADVAQPPAFDLIWLGMGRDGHTASLFPGSSALGEHERWVVSTWAPGPACWRLTLTLPVLNAAREALFTVVGADKAEALARVRAGDPLAAASRVDAERTLWLIDAATERAAVAA